MFYIDFTSPEGNTYRIDVSKNPVIHECPVCGNITIYEFDPEDANCCTSCVEQCRIQEEKERNAKADAKLVDHINRVFKSSITIDDLNRVKAEAKTSKRSIDEFISELKENHTQLQKKKWPDAVELAPNVKKISAQK